ncbi:MAG: crosslink repair DNA glycosylase YcaQ family protein, partial [Actinomycetota bacterium]|nr:crosslink repair DNA glycosylase YcaQ family protein [Actinomycetota bacterium]
SLDRDLLRDLLGAEELRELLDPGALADLELELQLLADGRRARTPDEMHDVLRKVGDLSTAEVDMRCEGEPDGEGGAGPTDAGSWLAQLVHERRAIGVSVAGQDRYIAAEDAARYRDAFGCNVPLGLPRAFTEPVPHPLEGLVGRYARTHGPFTVEDLAVRFGISVDRALGALAALEADGRVVRGEFRPNGSGREFSDVDVLRQLRRRSLAALRREVEPVEQQTYARFLLGWHSIPGERRGLDGLVEALGQLQGAALVASTLETEILPARLRSYRPTELDELCTAGELVWVGAGALGGNDGRIRLCFADQLPVLAQSWEPIEPPSGPLHVALREYLGRTGASFWGGLRSATVGDELRPGGATDTELLTALWDLVWAGEVTNDSLAPLRALLGAKGTKSMRPAGPVRGRPRPGRLARIGPPLGAGRWSLVAPLLLPAPSPTEAAHTSALQLLDRYGVVTREAVLAEGVRGGYAGVYGVLKVLEERGLTRRGYFVAGMGAAQFSLPGAVDRLRSLRDAPDLELHPADAEPPVALAATDPAQPYGAAISWPDSPGRPARSAGAIVVLRAGVPLVWFDRRSHHLVTFPATADDTGWAEALALLVKNGRVRSVEVRKVNGEPIALAMPWPAVLQSAGFVEGYKGWSFRA